MAKYPRIGRLTIGGTDYPAAVNTRVLMELEARGISIDTVLTDDGHRWANLVALVTMAINCGIRLSGDGTAVVTEDMIADSVDISELADLAGQISVLLGGSRTVEAEPPKN